MSERVQVAVVGGGPAGLAAAEVLARAGAQTVLFDENAVAGGQLRYRLGDIRTERGVATFPPRLAAELVEQARAAGAEIRTGCRAWGLFAGRELGLEHAGDATTVQAERILLATGSIDRSLAFPGGSLPGIFTGRAVQILLKLHFVRPGRRFVIVGDEPEASELAREVVLAGGEVVGRLPLAAGGLAAYGDQGVTRFAADGFEREVDVVVIAAGRMADSGLAFMAECAAGYSHHFGGFVPRVDEQMATSIEGIYLAGDCAGPTSPEIALLEGAYAGTAIAASLGLVDDAEFASAREGFANQASERIAALAAVTGSYVQVDRLPLGVVES